MTVYVAAAIIASSLVFLSEAIYIRGIFVADVRTGRKVRPSRSTFWILTFLQAMLGASYMSAGGGLAAGLSFAYALMFLPIAALSITHGYSKWSRTDTTCLAGSVIAGVSWWYTLHVLGWESGHSALFATVLLLITDFLGMYPTVVKSFADPASEHRAAWLLTVVATAINFLAVEEWTAADLAYNPYLLAINGLVAYALWRPRIHARPSL